MKKKGFCFKQAVSLLLAAAMILTAAPQTGTTAYAAEDSDASVDSQVLSVDDTLTDAESGENDADVDTTQPEDGQEESGEGSENGGDVLPEEPGQEEKPDDAEEPEEVTEPADEQEGDGEDTEGIVSEEETVSENTLAAEPMAENDASEGGRESGYKGESREEKDGDWSYRRLVISASGNGEDTLLSDAEIVKILKEYEADETQRFECVELNMEAAAPTGMKIKKDILNAAIDVLKKDHKDDEGNPRYWIDYNLYNNTSKEWRNITLSQPWDGADINVNVTMAPVAGLGIKLKFPAVSFPAEHVSMNVGGDTMESAIAAGLAGAGNVNEGWEFSKYSLFTLASGNPAAYVSQGNVWYNPNGSNGSDGKDIYVGNISGLKANTEYLMAAVADAESISAGGTKELTTPAAGATALTWKSYTPDVISINTKNGKTELSAWEEGEALYGVTYKESNATKAKFYRSKVGKELYKIDFLDKEIEMEVGNENYLNVVYYPSDIDTNAIALDWKITPENSGVIALDDGNIEALKPGTVTVTATYKKDNTASQSDKTQEDPFTATCTITVKGRLEYNDVEKDMTKMENNLYAVSGCDTKLGDVKFPEGMENEWKWKDPDLSLAPYAGSEGHEFTAICTREGGWSGEHTIWVSMVNVTGIAMQSRMPTEDGWTDWDQWWIPATLEKGDKLSLGFWYNMEGIRWINDDEGGHFDSNQTAAVEAKLAEKYKVEWSSTPKNLGVQKDDGTYEYTASVSGTKAEKKTFTVSLKDKTTNKVVWKANHTLTVTPNPLFDEDHWKLIDEAWGKKEIETNDTTGKLAGLTLTIKMPKTEYDKWKLTYTSLDTGILQLGKLAVTEGEVDGENNEKIKTTVVKIPCTQKNFGRVWIKVTAQDDNKSSQMYVINLEEPAPTLLSAATQTINKASSERSVSIVVSTSAGYPLAVENGKPVVSIAEAKSGKTDVKDYFETAIREAGGEEAAALLSENGGNEESNSVVRVYEMKLGLKGSDLSGLKAGNYAVKLTCKTKAVEGGPEKDQTVSLTVKVTDIKPKVTFKQTRKVNLFYTDDEGAGTLQINTDEEITSVVLKDYLDKNSRKIADCHYEVKSVGGVYQIVRKSNLATAFDEKLKKGTLEYTVDGYAGSFQTTFTVATENKAPVIVLSTKSETLYPNVGYVDSWISMTDKATGNPFVPDDAKYYVGKGTNRVETVLTIGAFDHENPESDAQIANEKTITGSASKNTYRLFVTNDGNIVSRLRGDIDPKNGKKADTINLELEKNNWSKPVAVSYKLQVNTAAPKLALGKAALTLNKNADVYRGQQERTTLRLKGFNDWVRNNDSWISITGQDDKSKAELKGKDSSLAIWYLDDCGDIVVRFNDNKIDAGTYKFKIGVAKHGEREYASTVLTVKIVDKTVKQSLKVTAKGSIDVLNREGTFISYTPKISNLTGTVEDGWLAGKDANLFDGYFEDGKLIVKASDWRKYSTKITYEVHTVFRVQTEDWRSYEVSSDNDPNSKPFKIKVKQGKPKLTVTAVDGNTLYRQRDNSVEFRVSAMLGKQEIKIVDVQQTDYYSDLWMYYDRDNQIVHVGIIDGEWGEIRKNGTYKPKLKVEYRDKAGDVKEAEIVCPIVVR